MHAPRCRRHRDRADPQGVTFPGRPSLARPHRDAGGSGQPLCAPCRAHDAGESGVVLNSVHVPLRDVIDGLNTEELVHTIALAQRACQQLGVQEPRIAVAGLNPHAGESGLFGREDIDVIAPAIAKARTLGIHASGPWPGDTIFMRARHHKEFDVVVAQYHDQGLIPIKYLGIDQGVNITLGLPFIRTSVDHGTAFDIAGKNIADPGSLVAAIALADRLASQQEHPHQSAINH